MLTRRVIVCLDTDDGRVVKGTSFRDLRDVGTPDDMAERYEAEGADEIVLLDISASPQSRATTLDVVERTAKRLSIPLTVGGGVRSVLDMALILRAGADKVAVNTAVVEQPQLVTHMSAHFGAQCVVVSIDAVREGEAWKVITHGGRRPTPLDAVDWAAHVVALGAGELLVTSIDQDGTRRGYDNALMRAIVDRVTVPVIASGGAGNARHLVDAIVTGGADAVLIAGILHDGDSSIGALKSHLSAMGISIRLT